MRRLLFFLVLTGLVLGGVAGAPPSLAARKVTVDNPGALISGDTLLVTVHLQGASPKQVEDGIPWEATDPRLSVGGWNVRAGYGYGNKVGEVRLVSNQGPTALFSLTAKYNGHYTFELGLPDPAADSDFEVVLGESATVEVDVASAQLTTLPRPPTNPRLEVTGTSLPVNSSVAYFQTRLVADGPIAPDRIDGMTSAGPTVGIRYAGSTIVATGVATSEWLQASMKWIDTGTKPEVSIKYEGSDPIIFYRDDLAFPLTYSAAAVYAVYPPESALRCGIQGTRLTCHITAYNSGVRGGAIAPTPQVVQGRAQIRFRSSSNSRFSAWRSLADGSLPMNAGYVVLTRSLPRRVAIQQIQIRLVVLGYPKSSAIAAAERGTAASDGDWAVSNAKILE